MEAVDHEIHMDVVWMSTMYVFNLVLLLLLKDLEIAERNFCGGFKNSVEKIRNEGLLKLNNHHAVHEVDNGDG